MEAPFENEDTERLFRLVQMLQRSAMLNMGLLAHPEGGHRFDLPEAKEAIDLIGALQRTTSGNLEARAASMLDGILSELRLQFVGAPARRRRLEEEEAQADTVRQAFASPREGPKEDL
jgi:hypothetical protein